MHKGFTLPYTTFDKLRSVHRAPVVKNKRLDDMLSLVAEMQAGRELQRSNRRQSKIKSVHKNVALCI